MPPCFAAAAPSERRERCEREAGERRESSFSVVRERGRREVRAFLHEDLFRPAPTRGGLPCRLMPASGERVAHARRRPSCLVKTDLPGGRAEER